MVPTMAWSDEGVVFVDQRRLPREVSFVTCATASQVAAAIAAMVVRGAPAIGVAAAMGYALDARNARGCATPDLLLRLASAADELIAARPTAVNLAWAVGRMDCLARSLADRPAPEIIDRLVSEALAMRDEDVRTNRAIGAHGQTLLHDGDTVLTHCNAGALATAGYGTALGVIRAAVEAGKRIAVLADETRPFLQGARLTAWELREDGIPVTLLCDNMAGWLMARGEVDAVIVGADRIAGNGDTANKIGTYSLAVLAREHQVPFYVAAPLSTVDLGIADGGGIPIEERPALEVTSCGSTPIAPDGVPARNPAFDVTPARLISAIITERGLARAPFGDSLRRLAEEGA